MNKIKNIEWEYERELLQANKEEIESQKKELSTVLVKFELNGIQVKACVDYSIYFELTNHHVEKCERGFKMFEEVDFKAEYFELNLYNDITDIKGNDIDLNLKQLKEIQNYLLNDLKTYY